MEPIQGVAAAAAAASMALGTAAPTNWPVELNGVTIYCDRPVQVMPADSDPDHPEYSWPSNVMYYGLMVNMSDGTQWRVSRPPLLYPDGTIQVPLSRKMPTINEYFTVNPEDVHTPIWNVGKAQPVPGPVEAPVQVENPPYIPPQNPGGGSGTPLAE